MVLEADSPVHTLWKSDLYRMQLDAPVPIPVISEKVPADLPPYLGRDYHGSISQGQANTLLSGKPDGAYLVRSSRTDSGQGDFHTLSLKFNDKVHHYKLYHDPSSGLYVREKRYDCVRSLVADGLVTMYLEFKAPLVLQRLATANYQESPYMTLNKRKLRVLTKESSSKNKGFIRESQNVPLSQQLVSPNFPEKVEKPHAFKLTTFKGLNWCELCGNFLWGFTFQGKKCEDCGMIAHVRCSEKIPHDCVPDLKCMRGVFGIELTTLLTAHNAALPFVVTRCVQEVEARGLTTEGLYRLSGFAEEIEAIKLAFDRDGERADLSEDKYPNINVITGALKSYLRLLPIPLVTFIVHPSLIDSMQHKNLDLRLSSLKYALTSLPRPHYDTLKYMIEHLHRVSLHAAINKMTAHNLATVFAPTLIGPAEMNGDLPDMTVDILLIETMIANCKRVFIQTAVDSPC